jgi:hypothetical protein
MTDVGGTVFEGFRARALWLSALISARLRGYGFGADCAFHVQNLIQGGITRLDSDNASGLWTLLKAAGALDRLVAEMVNEARAQNLTELRERTFFPALRKLCPLYPFC